jgi:glycosyltransferase involved in cell wall biosynthesis
MTSDPRVSVCVTTCNQQRYIRECLLSVVAQDPDTIREILVGDDCSDDGTSTIIAELAASHPRLIRHIRHASRIGPSANTKALLVRCTGEYVAKLDGDDYWLPSKLRRQLDFLENHPECAAVYTNALTISEDGQPIGLFNDAGDACFDLAALLRRGNFLNNSSLLLRATCIPAWLAIQGPLIDYRAHLLHARAGLLAHIGEPLVGYRVNATGAMTSTSASNDRVRKLYWEAILDVPRNLVTDQDLAHGVADFLRRVISRALRMRRWELAREWTPRVLGASPYGAARTMLLVMRSAARATCREILGRLRRGPDGRRVNIRHRR